MWRSLLSDREQQAKFNAAALLRGRMMGQAEFLVKVVRADNCSLGCIRMRFAVGWILRPVITRQSPSRKRTRKMGLRELPKIRLLDGFN